MYSSTTVIVSQCHWKNWSCLPVAGLPEDDVPDVEGVLIDASGGSPGPQHVLLCRQVVLRQNTVNIIQVAEGETIEGGGLQDIWNKQTS